MFSVTMSPPAHSCKRMQQNVHIHSHTRAHTHTACHCRYALGAASEVTELLDNIVQQVGAAIF